MSKIVINELDFHYIEYFNPVFEKVNLILDTDWCSGLIGRNGRGKTTFLKLLKGDLKPDRGTIVKYVEMEFFPYEYQTDYVVALDVLKELIGQLKTMEDSMERLLREPTPDNLAQYCEIQESYQEADGYEMEGRIKKELYLMNLSEDLLLREFELLSGGEKNKLLLIALFLRKNVFVLMDEPTNHLDIHGKHVVAEYLRQKTGFLVVSHDRQFLDNITDHILAINKTNITLEKGNYSSWKDNVEKIEVYEQRTKTHLEKEIASLERGAATRRNWAEAAEKEKNPFATHNRGNGSRAAKFMRQAKNAEAEAINDIASKKELLKNLEVIPELSFYVPEKVRESQEQELLVWIDKLTFGYSKSMLFQDFSMSISAGERIWIKGSNGCGKSTLLKVISGQLDLPCRNIQEDIIISVSYQEPQWQDGYAKEWISEQVKWERFLSICSCLDITMATLERPIQTCSSGEKCKLDIARALSAESDILLLDEPLNYMDVYFREQLERAVLVLQPTIVFVEHDERFGRRVATRSINLDS